MTTSIVTITYEHHGTTPPIFIAGSFTDPAWQPVELDHKQVNGEYIFSKTFDITPGMHRYKFRVGHGDWWVCDDMNSTGLSIL
jgi:Glycogen recognition site of AMP-activated protein kinase